MTRRNFVRAGALWTAAIPLVELARPEIIVQRRAFTAGAGVTPISLDTHIAIGSIDGDATTTDPVTVAGSLIILAGSNYGGAGDPALADNKSNTYNALTAYGPGSEDDPRCMLAYCTTHTPGSGFTFTNSRTGGAAPSVFMASFNLGGIFDSGKDNGASGLNGTSGASGGGFTPSVDNCLVIAFLAVSDAITGLSAPAGFTLIDSISFASGFHYGGQFYYKVQSSKTATDPSWSWTGSIDHSQAAGAWQHA